MALPTVDASRILRRASGLPEHCWPTSRSRPGSTSSGSPKRYRSLWQTIGCPLKGKRRPAALQEYIKRSRSNRAHFDALEIIWQELNCRGESIPDPLDKWRTEFIDGLRPRPDRKPVPAHRPVRAAQLVRDIQIQFTIEVLRRVGVKPRGSSVSGCGIVSEVLELSEETVNRIWKERILKRPFGQMGKHSKAIAERTLPLHTTKD